MRSEEGSWKGTGRESRGLVSSQPQPGAFILRIFYIPNPSLDNYYYLC